MAEHFVDCQMLTLNGKPTSQDKIRILLVGKEMILKDGRGNELVKRKYKKLKFFHNDAGPGLVTLQSDGTYVYLFTYGHVYMFIYIGI
jgi:hypothetical protein